MILLRNPADNFRPAALIIPLEDVKQAAVESALILCQGDLVLAARHLRISRASMYRWVKRFREQDKIDSSGMV